MQEIDFNEIVQQATTYNKKVFDEFGKYIKYYEYGIQQGNQQGNEPDSGDAEERPSSNQVYKYVSKVLPLLYHQDPTISIAANLGANSYTIRRLHEMGLVGEGMPFKDIFEAKEVFADMLSYLMDYSYRETLSVEYNKACVFEALVKGQSASMSCVDTQREISKIDCVRREELYIDPTARLDITQAEYVSRLICNPVNKSKAYFKSIGFNGPIEANTTMSEQNVNEKDYFSGDTGKMKAYKFLELWCKDYDNGNHIIYYLDAVTKKKIHERPWPFKLDVDDFPFEVLSYNKKYTCMRDAFPEIKVVEGIWKFYEYLIWYFYDDTMRTLAHPILYDPNIVSQPKLDELVKSRGRVFIPVENLDKAKLSEYFMIPDLGEGSDNPLKYIELMTSLADGVLGMDTINAVTASKLKDVREQPLEMMEEAYQTKLEDKQAATDLWLTRQVRHRVQITRQITKGAKVAALLGDKSAALWDILAYDVDDLTNEYSINVLAGSSGSKAKRERFNRLMKIYDRLKQANADAGMPLYTLREVIRDLIRLEGDSHIDRYENKNIQEQIDTGTRQPVYPNKQNVEGMLMGVKANLFDKNEARGQLGLNPTQDSTMDFSVLDTPEDVQTNVTVPASVTPIDEASKAIAEDAVINQAESAANEQAQLPNV